MMQGAGLSVSLYRMSYLDLQIFLRGSYYGCPHFTDEAIEAWRYQTAHSHDLGTTRTQVPRTSSPLLSAERLPHKCRFPKATQKGLDLAHACFAGRKPRGSWLLGRADSVGGDKVTSHVDVPILNPGTR